ncbi:MAG: hypothetical protein JWQ28_1055 [Pedobacter sp.]|jgi:hypothetical protein|nr:hypothetical protein [Pedobacter sp.]
MSVILASSFIYKAADAQVRVNLNVNLGSQPQWGPSGYDHVDYYYMPDLDMYYNVPNRTYTYNQGNRWVTVNSVPAHYRNYDFYRGYKVVVNEQNPWNHNDNYRTRYASYKGNRDQVNLRDYDRRVVKTKVVKYNKYDKPDKHQRYEEVRNVRSYNDNYDGHDQRGNKDHGRKGRG